MKKILFVINTMGRAGAELSLINLLKIMERKGYDVSLYVLIGQGEMIRELPPYVRILNPSFDPESVLSEKGRRRMALTVAKSFFRNGKCIRKIGYVIRNLFIMLRNRRVQIDKLFWRVVAEGAKRFEEQYDLAVAWLEGGSAYYVAEWVKADKKAAFLHIDYEKAGYTRELDGGCWKCFDRVFAVSEDAAERFRAIYPEYKDKTTVFRNMVDQDFIRKRAGEPGGFSDHYDGFRILTVGRLTYQKGYDIAVEAVRKLKDAGYSVRWYVLGDGDQRNYLEKKIARLGVERDFILLGSVENPYPYYRQADLYVHAVRYEGQGIAVWEAQTLGCAVIVSDYCGSREQVENGRYGISCELTPEGIADSIKRLLDDADLRVKLGQQAATKKMPKGYEELLYELVDQEETGKDG